MDRLIRVVYDLNYFITEWLMENTNVDLRESYNISPATFYDISPNGVMGELPDGLRQRTNNRTGRYRYGTKKNTATKVRTV